MRVSVVKSLLQKSIDVQCCWRCSVYRRDETVIIMLNACDNWDVGTSVPRGCRRADLRCDYSKLNLIIRKLMGVVRFDDHGPGGNCRTVERNGLTDAAGCHNVLMGDGRSSCDQFSRLVWWCST